MAYNYYKLFNAKSSLYIYIKVKLATIAEGDPNAPFSIGVAEGATSFPELVHFTLDPYLIMLILTKEVSSTII